MVFHASSAPSSSDSYYIVDLSLNLFMFILRYTFVDSTSPRYSIVYIASMNSVRGLGRVIVGLP